MIFEKLAEILDIQAGLLKETTDLIRELKKTRENEEEYLLSIKDAAKRMGLAESTLRRLIAQKEIKAVKIGGKLVVPASEITRLVRLSN